jgi:hypothetical protein
VIAAAGMRTMHRLAVWRLSLAIVVLTGFISTISVAQTLPFSQMEVSLTGHQNIPSNDAFYEFFGTGFGTGLNLRTPFYAGNAEIGLQWHKYRKNLVTVPKMTALFIHVGWGYPLRMGAVQIEPGFRLGNYRMMFEMDNAFRSELDESEFTTSLNARLQLDLGKRAALHAEASKMTVYTSNRLYYTYLGAGVSYRFSTNNRIREALLK